MNVPPTLGPSQLGELLHHGGGSGGNAYTYLRSNF